ncbi:uncharacterized protein [Prorops nasuta]|uniref:uncharacterized protein n=1 Tax=Prorops nasuta TaxID=863751 RepID=UPI0034CE4B95
METLKDCYQCYNPHWLVIVASGMYLHLRNNCIIGFCLDEDPKPPFDPSYSSHIFMISVLCLLAEYKLWPRSLKDPPILLLYIYDILVTALVTNLVKRIIWIPLLHVLYCLTKESSIFMLTLIDILNLDKHSYLNTIAYFLDQDFAAVCLSYLTSLLSFLWMLDATENLDAILDVWAN